MPPAKFICLKSTIKTPEKDVKYVTLTIKIPVTSSDFFIINFERISYLFLVARLLTLNKESLAGLWDTFLFLENSGTYFSNISFLSFLLTE